MFAKEVALLTAPQRTAETGSGDLMAGPDGPLTGPDALLAALDPEQQQVALASRGPVCVLAGAGTGKTRAVTHRIAYAVATGVVSPDRVLAVTFTTRAAGELRARLRQLGAAVPGAGLDRVQALTFHSAALRQLTHFWPSAVGGPAPRVLDSKVPLIAEAARQLRITAGSAELRDIATEIEWAKVSQVRPEGYAEASAAFRGTLPIPPDQLSRVYAAYEELRRARNLVDFESVLELTAALLAETPAVAASVRDRYAYFTVDEYQDINPLQKLLLDVWLGGRDDVCVVGDPSQTIYSFTGASSDYLLGFRTKYPQAREVRLIRDYRSTPQVVAVANGILTRARLAPRMRLQLQAQRPSGPAVRWQEHADEQAEAEWVASEAAQLLAQGVRASEVAVLFRTNGQSEQYEQALSDAGVPYVVRGSERFFDRREVREALLLLRGAARSGSGDEPAAEATRAILSSTGWSEEAPRGGGASRERWESLAAIARVADDLVRATPGATLSALVAELEERAAAAHAPVVEGVTLASLHSAKGLEWDAVFLVGVVDGLLPITYAETDEAVEEERRLLYVGVTRARERLVVSWSRARGRRPSRFLDGLRPGVPATGGGGSCGAASARGRKALPSTCGVCGRPLPGAAQRKTGRCDDCPPGYDEDVYERLRTWRLAQAREQSLPAFVVFTDATLAAIAEVRPQDLRGLAGIPGVGAAKLEKYGVELLRVLLEDDRATTS